MRFLTISVLFLVGCNSFTMPQSTTYPLTSTAVTSRSTQLVVVISDHWDATQGQLYSFEKLTNNQWQAQSITGAVTLGKKGLAWGVGLHPTQAGLSKAEGDGRAPAGLFRLSGAFGYSASAKTKMPYQAMQAEDYCIDVAQSPLYNQTVDRSRFQSDWTAGSTEPMRRDIHFKGDQAYQRGLFIDHNAGRVPNAGSCIFMHQWQSPVTATAGCTAMSESQISALLAWLDPAKQPLYLLLPKEQYLLLRQSWQLPELPLFP